MNQKTIEYTINNYVIRKVRDSSYNKKYVAFDASNKRCFHFIIHQGEYGWICADIVIHLNVDVTDSVIDAVISHMCAKEGIKLQTQ